MIRIERAMVEHADEAYAIVREYYDAVDVVVRDNSEEFAEQYFGPGSGIWLAREDKTMLGCIALRPLPQMEQSGEVKRLYVKPQGRGRGIADGLLEALEEYAAEFGYRRLYLDTKDDLLPAIRFYEQHGYERCERYNQNPQATIFMAKDLPESELQRDLH
ncbi:MAG TPA: GNAT family N-acetyltransferase [Silvibacterium sp.]|nr:GNAT family N-acetyltransferase [Silvibacterium sp.]